MPTLPSALRKRLIALTLAGAGVGAMTAGYTGYFEGDPGHAYTDVAGVPTECYGHTGPDVRLGTTQTEAQCQALLQQDLQPAFATLDRTVTVPLTRGQRVALASFIYNVGAGNFAHSTLLKKLNAGDITGACHELERWEYAGGKKWAGLVSRREADEWLCLNDLPTP
ncbi:MULTISPECIES: lysozyme [Serratia]|uniref:lysozyme n=1 Tax=Serratia TaxID=613 RepID=UPI000660F252|nr:lysozyme [Serratia sp. 506_PEND]